VRASRLVSALLLLQARGRLTAAQLASELEVSERTVTVTWPTWALQACPYTVNAAQVAVTSWLMGIARS